MGELQSREDEDGQPSVVMPAVRANFCFCGTDE